MNIPFVCVFVAFLLIYAPRMGVLRAQIKDSGGLDNKHPRDQQAKLVGVARRLNAAHNNGFEAFAPFAAAVVIAHLAQADAAWSMRLAVTFVVARTVYILLYAANLDKARSTVWTIGFGAVIGLFVLALVH